MNGLGERVAMPAVDLEQIRRLLATDGWLDRVDVHMTLTRALEEEVVDTWRVDTSRLGVASRSRARPDSPAAYVPILFGHPIEVARFEVIVVSAYGSRPRQAIPECSLAAAAEAAGLQPGDDTLPLKRCLVVPLYAEELDCSFPLVVAKYVVRPTRKRRLGWRAAMSPVAIQPVEACVGNLDHEVILDAEPSVQIVSVFMDAAKVLRGQALIDARIASAQARAAAADDRSLEVSLRLETNRISEAAHALSAELRRADDWVTSVDGSAVGWARQDVEDLRGHIAAIAAETRTYIDADRLDDAAKDLERLTSMVEDLQMKVGLAVHGARKVIRLPSSSTRIDIAFTSAVESEGPRQRWSLGTATALVAMFATCAGLLFAVVRAADVTRWLADKSDGIVAILAVTIALFLSQIEHVAAHSTRAARRAKQQFLRTFLVPLAFPVIAGFEAVQQHPNSAVLEFALVLGLVSSVAVDVRRRQSIGWSFLDRSARSALQAAVAPQ